MCIVVVRAALDFRVAYAVIIEEYYIIATILL